MLSLERNRRGTSPRHPHTRTLPWHSFRLSTPDLGDIVHCRPKCELASWPLTRKECVRFNRHQLGCGHRPADTAMFEGDCTARALYS